MTARPPFSFGLGRAESGLPALAGGLRFSPRQAVSVNLVSSFAVLAAAVPFRAGAVPPDLIAPYLSAAPGNPAGSLSAAWLGAGWVRGMSDARLGQAIPVLLVGLGVVLMADGLFVTELMRLVPPDLVPTVLAGSILGTMIGAQLPGFMPSQGLKIGLGPIPIWSAWGVFSHLPAKEAG